MNLHGSITPTNGTAGRLNRSALLAALLLVASLVTPLAAATATDVTASSVTVDRSDGGDRHETACKIAERAFPTADRVLIARADAYFDALAGNYLAGQLEAPILLLPSGHIDDETAGCLDRLGVSEITLLGGTAVLTEQLEEELAQTYTVTRVEGDNRHQTAKRIAEAGTSYGTVDGLRTAIVASSANFPDALVSGGIAYDGAFPVLLTAPQGLDRWTAAALEGLDIQHVLIAGGDVAVSQGVEDEIEAMGISTRRFAGSSRTETATIVADFATAELGWTRSRINLARGDDFPDALALGPYSGAERAAILLTWSPTALDGSVTHTEDWLREHAAQIGSLHIAGGETAIEPDVVDRARDAVDHAIEAPEDDGIVNTRSGASYTTFADALDAAAPGDVLSATGVFEESVTIGPDLDDLTIDGHGETEIVGDVTLDADLVTLTRLTIYGDLYINGDTATVTRTQVRQTNPGGNVYVEGDGTSFDDVSVEQNLQVNGTGFQRSNVEVEGTESGSGYSIQSAIDDASPGDTIVVGEGTYREQLFIDKDITLRGEHEHFTDDDFDEYWEEHGDFPHRAEEVRRLVTLEAPDDLRTVTIAEDERTFAPIIFAYGGTESAGLVSGDETARIFVEGFAIDGREVQAGDAETVGILARNVETRTWGIRYHSIDRLGGADHPSTGIAVLGASDLDVSANIVSSYTRTGIEVRGEGDTHRVVNVSSNLIEGPGYVETDWVPHGILRVHDRGSNLGNDVSDHRHPTGESTGIRIVGSGPAWGGVGGHVRGNDIGISVTNTAIPDAEIFGVGLSGTIEDNEVGMYLSDVDGATLWSAVFRNNVEGLVLDSEGVLIGRYPETDMTEEEREEAGWRDDDEVNNSFVDNEVHIIDRTGTYDFERIEEDNDFDPPLN